jgi:hypothetical protein
VTLVDTSAWIELLRGTGSAVHLRLRELVRGGDELATTGPVSMELLAGARTPTHARRIRAALAACRTLEVRGTRDWEDAAALYLTCRLAGLTPRKLLDCLIAAVAIRAGVPVLAQDRDFELIAEHTALELLD